VHPVTAVQSEYSLFTRDVEKEMLPILDQHGIGFVPYSPLGRGLLTGKIDQKSINKEGDFRQLLPRNQGDNFRHNMKLVEQLRKIAENKGVTPAQLALSWVLSKGDNIVPIPGTRQIKYLKENIAAADLVLEKKEIEQLESIFHPGAVLGDRYTEEGMKGLNA